VRDSQVPTPYYRQFDEELFILEKISEIIKKGMKQKKSEILREYRIDIFLFGYIVYRIIVFKYFFDLFSSSEQK
jgi:hypothetical protein